MVEEITYEELEKLWGHSNGSGIRFFLTHYEIEHWKKEGHFKHLKNEIINIPNIKFICLQELHGCWYTFFTHSRTLSDKVINIVRKLRKDKHIHIVNSKIKFDPFLVQSNEIYGVQQHCNLF